MDPAPITGVYTVGTLNAVPKNVEIYERKGTGKPASLLDKLGVKPGHRVLLAGHFAEDFITSLTEAGADVSVAQGPDHDLIFLEANSRLDLAELGPLQQHLKRNGAIWSIRPRGVKAITERDVMDVAKSVGLVDVKVARFSDTHTAEKLVIPVSSR